MAEITFNKKGYDGFIDFIKAYAILCVLLGHTFEPYLQDIGYSIWAGMQVPLFILVQTFHGYKKEKVTLNLKKILTRVMVPFLVLEVITFVIALLIGKSDAKSLALRLLYGGGYGPGSYYPWIYLQIALLLPVFSFILKRVNKTTALLLFLIISEGFEIGLSLVHFPNWMYRCLAIRYIFLIYLGWIWAKDGIKISFTNIILTIISLGALIYFGYFYTNTEPWFYDTDWFTHRWPTYFFVAFGLSSLLYFLYRYLRKSEIIEKCIKTLAAASYEIFLLQMFIIYFVKQESLTFVENGNIRYVLWILMVWAFSIAGGICVNKFLYQRKG